MATLICGFWIGEETWCALRSHNPGTANVVDLPGEGPKVKDAEQSHFDAEQHGRDANLDVGSLYGFGGFYSTSGGKNRDDELTYENELVGVMLNNGRMGQPTVCQNDRKITSLMAATFRSGLCSARSALIWM